MCFNAISVIAADRLAFRLSFRESALDLTAPIWPPKSGVRSLTSKGVRRLSKGVRRLSKRVRRLSKGARKLSKGAGKE